LRHHGRWFQRKSAGVSAGAIRVGYVAFSGKTALRSRRRARGPTGASSRLSGSGGAGHRPLGGGRASRHPPGIPCPFGDDRLYGTGHCAHGGIHRSSGGHGRRRSALSPGCFRLFTGGRLRRRIRPRSHGLHPRGSAPGPRTAPIGRGGARGEGDWPGFYRRGTTGATARARGSTP